MSNLFKQDTKVQRTDRNQMNGHTSFVLWFTGLSGSGKSTVAANVQEALFRQGVQTYMLDGDNVRMGLNNDLGFDDAGRVENIRRIAEVAKLFVDAGMVVITSFISPFTQERERARNIIGNENFIEVYVECPLEVCEQRDVKGLYARARKGEIPNFTGITSPYEEPKDPEIRITTHQNNLDECTQRVLEYIESKMRLE